MRKANAEVQVHNSPDAFYDAVCDELRANLDGERGCSVDFHPAELVNGWHMNVVRINDVVCGEDHAVLIIGDYAGHLAKANILKLEIGEKE